MRAENAGKIIINKLEQELPAHLTYHNAEHTRDVHDAAKRIAGTENISAEELDLLLAAAWYHDSGFLTCITGHEEESCRIAMEDLPASGYRNNEITQICEMIKVTRLPQSPQNHLQQILADADLDYLGRKDFFIISEKLFEELRQLGSVEDRIAWDNLQVEFLEKHQYFTKTSLDCRQAQKAINLAEIKARLHRS